MIWQRYPYRAIDRAADPVRGRADYRRTHQSRVSGVVL
jgi:hypothetical protein